MNRKNGLWIVLRVILVIVTAYFAFAFHPFGKGYAFGKVTVG
jgi:hypothetical protein